MSHDDTNEKAPPKGPALQWYQVCPHCGGRGRVFRTVGMLRRLRCSKCKKTFKRVFRTSQVPLPAALAPTPAAPPPIVPARRKVR